jgi:hypothetical protein
LPCVRSLRHAARLLIVRIAPALLRLCHASRRVVSTLNFLSVNRTGSRCASGYCVSRRDYSSSRLHRLYCAYVVHPDAPSRHSTSRRSAALALTVRPVTASRGATTSFGLHQLYCAYAVHPDAPSRRSTSRRSVALALIVRPVTASCSATTRRPDCTGSTAPMSCIRTRHLDARLLVSRSHWLSSCARSIPLCIVTTRLAAATNLLFLHRAIGCLGCCDVVFRSHRVDYSSQLVFQTSRERQSRPQLVGINSN